MQGLVLTTEQLHHETATCFRLEYKDGAYPQHGEINIYVMDESEFLTINFHRFVIFIWLFFILLKRYQTPLKLNLKILISEYR